MNVLLIGNYVPDAQDSMQKFADVLLRGLSRAGISVELLRPSAWFGSIRPGRTGTGKWLGYLDKFLRFPHQLARRLHAKQEGQVIVHVCDHSQAIYTRYLSRVPHLVTCHDLLAVQSALGEVPENPTRWSGRQLQRIILGGLNLARHVACVSAHTQKELLRVSKLRMQDTSVCHNGLNFPFARLPQAEARERVGAALSRTRSEVCGLADGMPGSFLLHVGGDAWYKNRMGVLQIYAHFLRRVPDAPGLVMIGKPLEPKLKDFITEQGLASRVASVPNCSDMELCGFYSLAEALVFPSLAEGFGWPIVEAQACGCRVVTSNRPPMTEVAGDSGYYLDPTDSFRAAKVLCAAFEEPASSRHWRAEAGLRNAARFTTDKMIQGYLGIYQGLISPISPCAG